MASPGHEPERLGRYEILLPIASGGMATVYLARAHGAHGFGREVALKLVHAHLRETAGFALDLIEEAKLAARIRHPNVVPILDAADDPLGVYLVMEYVEGDTLIGLLRKSEKMGTEVPRPVALRILVDALHGLHAAHELRDEAGRPIGLVHRDFSPQNILVGVDGVAKLSDFGIAKASTRLGQTSTGLVKGKIGYMAPEQARGKPLDRRCDLWAAGVIAWELLAKRRLYKGDNDVAVALAIVSGSPPRLRDVAPEVHPELDAIVSRALSTDVAARCPTAQELADELGAAARPLGGLAEIPEVAAFVRELLRSHLASRRELAAQVIARRAEGTSTRAPVSVPADRRDRPERTRRRRVAALAIALTASVATAFGVVEMNRNEPPSGAPEAATMGAAPPGAPPSSTEASAAPTSLELRADAPIARLKIGKRPVAVAPAAPVVVLALRPDEYDQAVELEVFAADGRRANVALEAGARSIDVVFPGAEPTRPGRAPARGSTRPAKGEPLAPSPYVPPP